MLKLIKNIAYILVLALAITSCSKEEFTSSDDIMQPSKRALSKDADTQNGITTPGSSDLFAQPDSKGPSLASSVDDNDGSTDNETGRNGISDDDDDENDDDRGTPSKPKKK